ncbi:hypothetical protein [Leptolyngbya sp. GGD]|uniref:hypothetical protein n=1 Tax=Leptolyngbya sp. GGD TaxID=2997907 RepID=UPI00227D67D0|nr:hypothetical protein [Leptolyngbya sp. GGD]MCY6490265.1 hypothetical protein [Leptolyngbya sp. GGD]
MEPITWTAATITALIIVGAINKVGESLVEGAFTGSSQLTQYVYKKFEERGKQSLLASPEKHQEAINAELVEQMQEDSEHQKHLEQLLKATGITRQIVLSNLEVGGSLKAGNINLRDFGSRLLEQVVISNAKITKDIEVGDVSLESKKTK